MLSDPEGTAAAAAVPAVNPVNLYSEFSVLEPIVDTLSTFETQLMQKNVQIKGLDTSRITIYADIDLIHQVIYSMYLIVKVFGNQKSG